MTAARLLAMLVLGFALAGCSAWVWPDQPQVNSEPPAWLTRDHVLGQTFTALEGGLSGIEIYLTPDLAQAAAPDAALVLTLHPDPHTPTPLAQATLPLRSVTQAGFQRFVFAPLPGSLRQDYYVQLALNGADRVAVGQGPGAAYWSGALYLDGEPANAQVAFRLVYTPAGVLWGMFGDALRFAGWLAAAGFLLTVPGWALLAGLWPASRTLSFGERLGLAVGLSAALYPLLYLWTHVVGLHLGPGYTWLPIAAGLVALASMAWRAGVAPPQSFLRDRVREWWQAGHGWPDLALVALLAAVFFTRWWVARPLNLPLWGDSLQHTMIVQLLLDHGGLFNRWAPYAELESFTYHFGFHTLVAGFQSLSGLAVPQATLWLGQIVNGLAVLALYPLGARLSGNRWGGVAAVLVAGLLSTHPAYYTNWGRYTQLAGQVLLPAAVYLTWVLADTERHDMRLVTIGSLLVAGLALTHYRVLLMYGCFVLALLVVQGRAAGRRLRPLLAVAVGAGLLSLPWMLAGVGRPLLAFVTGLVTTPAADVSGPIAEFTGSLDLSAYSWLVWLAAGAGAVAGLARRRGPTLVVFVWWGFLVLLANPARLGLPGSGLVNNFAIQIAAYMAAGLLASGGAAWLVVPRVARWWPVALALALAAGGVGFRQQLQVVDAGHHMLAGRPDLRAAAWIDSHLPSDATLLVNSFFAYSGNVLVSGDAGVWLPLLAHRAVTTPPISYTSEVGPEPDYRLRVTSLAAAVRDEGIDAPRVQTMLREYGVTHVYIGQQQEQTNPGEPFVLSLADLLASPHFQLVYHEDRVLVFKLLAQMAPE